jgi:hypothetical protein
MAATPTLTLGSPSSGWLPVRLQAEDQIVEFIASTYGLDPLEQLCNSLLDVGRESTTTWDLEPDLYEFVFSPAKKEVLLEVRHVEPARSGRPAQRSPVLRWSGEASHIVVPFWRVLKRFQTAAPDAWPSFPARVFSQLEERARAYKNEG